MSEADPIAAPPFRPDFAARAVTKARTIKAQRRLAGASLLAIAALSAAWLAPALRQDAQPPAPRYVAYRMPVAAAAAMQAGQLELLFPDAKPLVGFDRNYTAAMSGIRVDDQSFAQDTSSAYDAD
jgi:hypothetical protein